MIPVAGMHCRAEADLLALPEGRRVRIFGASTARCWQVRGHRVAVRNKSAADGTHSTAWNAGC